MVTPGTIPPKEKSSSGPIGETSISALQGRIGVPELPRTQFSSAGRNGIFGLSAPSHEAHGGKARFPTVHRRPLSDRSEEQKQELHNLMLRLSGNPFPEDRPDPQNNSLKLTEDRGRLVVCETTSFVSSNHQNKTDKEGKWRWDQEAKRNHTEKRMLQAQETQKECLPSGIRPVVTNIHCLPADHVDWQASARDTAPIADREELSLRLAAERRSERAVQHNPLGRLTSKRKYNRTEEREHFWTFGKDGKDGLETTHCFPYGHDSSRGTPRTLDPSEKKWADGLLLDDMVRAKYGTDAGRIAQATWKAGGRAHIGQ